MRRQTATHQSGFSLIEALIVIALLGIFLTILTSLLTSIVDVQNQSSDYSAVTSDGRFIMSRLNYDIARASSVTTPGTLGTSTSSLVMTINATTYTYALSAGDLQLTDGVGTANLNGNRTTVSSLTFQRLGNVGGVESIRYSFTLTGTVEHAGHSDVQSFTSTTERRG